jgi:hypothetical protein
VKAVSNDAGPFLEACCLIPPDFNPKSAVTEALHAAEISSTSLQSVYFGRVKATLAQLRRDTRKIDRPAACQDLMAIGPVKFLPRK